MTAIAQTPHDLGRCRRAHDRPAAIAHVSCDGCCRRRIIVDHQDGARGLDPRLRDGFVHDLIDAGVGRGIEVATLDRSPSIWTSKRTRAPTSRASSPISNALLPETFSIAWLVV